MRIEDFPLSWRWTSESHAVLPSEILQGLQPVAKQDIRDLSLQEIERNSDSSIRFQVSEKVDTKSWLRSLPVDVEQVTLIWNAETALRMPWDTFMEWWDDFCYPSSDDVTILISERQYLLWHHYEQFEFSSRPTAP